MSRCVNCSLSLVHPQPRRQVGEATDVMLRILRSWVTPATISVEDVLCQECYTILERTSLNWSIGTTVARVYGHQQVCLGCGSSILRARTHRVIIDSPEGNVIMLCIPIQQAHRLERVCLRCWTSAYRSVRRQTQHGGHRQQKIIQEEAVAPEVASVLETSMPTNNIAVPTPPPQPIQLLHQDHSIYQQASTSNVKKAKTVKTCPKCDCKIEEFEKESHQIEQDTENFVQYKIMKQEGVNVTLRLNRGVLPHKFHCQNRNLPPPVLRISAIKRKRLSRIEEALSESTANSNDVLKICEPLQTNDEAGTSSSLIEEVKFLDSVSEKLYADETKAVIAKVYHYFEQEFEELKKIYPDVDLTPLSRFLHRTAVATGVSRTTVQDILKEEQEQSTVFEESCQRRRKASKRRRGSDSTFDEDSSLASDHGDEHPDDADVTDDGDQVENSENEEATPTATVSSEKQVEPPDDKEDLHQSPSSQSELHFGPTTVKIEPLDYEENMTQTELIFDPLSMKVERRDGEENKGGQDATVVKMKIENNEEGFS